MPGGVHDVTPSPFMLLAILLGNLPVRYWDALEERFPVHRMAWLSGTLTMLGGIALGMTAFLSYAADVASRTNQAYIDAHGDFGLLPGAGMAVLPMFLLTTPGGVLSLYLTGSGFLRAVGAFLADDPRGDFILTGIDAVLRGRVARTRAARRDADRQRREGAAVPDRLVRGDQIGRPDLALVLLASRAKTGWETGAYLVGADGAAHRIGDAFDVDSPAGLRMAYPLTPLTTLEPIRHAIPYELPRTRGTVGASENA